MTLLLSAARRRNVIPDTLTATAAPWNSSTTPCTIPTYDGSGATIHPSVVDMGGVWNGYRWWMANTPYPEQNNDYENPCVWGSNDRRTWEVPAGATNPVDPMPTDPWFHSDTELVWDPDRGLVLYYRLASSEPTIIYFRAQSSTDGVTWTNHRTLLDDLPDGSARLSPAIWRAGPEDWRLWTWGSTTATAAMRTASSSLGPWGTPTPCTLDGGVFTGWHGDVVRHGSKWIAAYSTAIDSGVVRIAASNDGIAWADGGTLMSSATGTGWDTRLYRPTLHPAPETGYVDCWYSAYGPVTGGCATDYVRLPDTLWPAAPSP